MFLMEQQKDKELKRHSIRSTKGMVLTALLFAIAIILSIVENSLPSAMIGVPGVKLGLSNIAVMYGLFFLSKRQGYMIAVLKATFVFFTRGTVAGLLSLVGGILSLTVIVLLMLVFKKKISYLLLSIAGAIFHNIGQLIGVSFLYTTLYIWAYLPVLIVTGILAGIGTSTLLKFILPAFQKLGLK